MDLIKHKCDGITLHHFQYILSCALMLNVLTNLETPFLVQHHVTIDGELLATPWARALDSLLLDIMDQFTRRLRLPVSLKEL